MINIKIIHLIVFQYYFTIVNQLKDYQVKLESLDMKHLVDMSSWKRKNSFEFFLHFKNPNISITSEIDCTHAMAVAKEKNESFFIYYIYSMLVAMNEVEEFRYRIDAQDQVIFFDEIDITTPILLNDDGDCSIVRIPLIKDFTKFYAKAKQIIEVAKGETESNFGVDNLNEENDPYSTIFLSATPDLYFTSLVGAQEHSYGNSYPLLNVGKAVVREGKTVMPVAITISHAFADGMHISRFMSKTEAVLNAF